MPLAAAGPGSHAQGRQAAPLRMALEPLPVLAARGPRAGSDTLSAAAVASKKLSYKEQRELEAVPARIEALEAEERQLHARMAGPEFYKEGSDAIAAALARLEAVSRDISEAYARWHELESRSSG